MPSTVDLPVFGARDDLAFLEEMRALDAYHRARCEPFARIAAGFLPGDALTSLPFVHVSLFKDLELRSSGVQHGRTLLSSATTSGRSSRIAMDETSGERQSKSVTKIIAAWIGEARRPLLVLDDARGLRDRAGVSARIAAALSLKALSSDLRFVLSGGSAATVNWSAVEEVLSGTTELIVYGFTWILWKAWGEVEMPSSVRTLLARTRVMFVHSGGWKRLEQEKVDRATFDETLLRHCAEGSQVLDYYGLVEQVGVVFPLCSAGARHVPPWADVLVRDTYTLHALAEEPGQLQLLNVLPLGGPYHSVLTEDMGRILPGPCPCGREGRRFELIGRVPKAETRGCANV